jgi:hypothetical protein
MDGFIGMPRNDKQTPPGHAGRNIFIVLGAVLIIAIGVFVLLYKDQLFGSSPPSVSGTSVPSPQQPITPQEKVALLQAASASPNASATTSLDRMKVLQSAQPKSSTPAPSSADRIKLLQALQH